jgi:hypothetical protein
MTTARCAWLVIGAIVSASAQAGLVFTQTSSNNSDRGNASRTVMRLALEADKARGDVLEMSDANPMLGPGAYVLMVADKPGMLIVKPADQAYLRMDPRDFRGMQQMGSQFESNAQEAGAETGIEDLKVNKKVDEAGPAMLGMPTHHYLYEISYLRPMGMKNSPVKVSMAVTETREIWATHALDAKLAGMSAFKSMASMGMTMGGSMAQLVEVEQQIAANGFVLKSIRTTDSKMHSSIPIPATMFARSKPSRSVMEITELHEEPLQAEQFTLPKGFTEREMLNPNAGSMPDLNKVPGGRRPPAGNPPQGMPDLDKIQK